MTDFLRRVFRKETLRESIRRDNLHSIFSTSLHYRRPAGELGDGELARLRSHRIEAGQ